MKLSEALMGARGQLAWILALVLSTATVIYLENLDIGAVARSAPASDEAVALAASALSGAEAAYRTSPDARSAADLVMALCLAVQAGALDLSEGQTRVEALREQATRGRDAVAALIALTFGR